MEIQATQPNQTPTQPEPTQPEPTPTYVTYSDYTNTRLTCTPSEQKTIPGTGPQAVPPSAPQYYYQVPLMYNFGAGDVRQLNDFLFEGCELDTSFGIQSKPGQSGRTEHSVMCKFDVNNPDHARMIESVNQIHAGCAYILQQMKGAVKLYNFNAQMAEATGLKNPIYYPRDEMTGEHVQGRSPSTFLKLFSRGKPPMVEQTLFTGVDGKAIPWKLLEGVEMKFIPLIHIKRIYVGGGKASIQMEVVSAVVTSIRARNTTTRQLGTIQRLNAARPELADTVAAQLAKLTIDRQNQMLGDVTPNIGVPQGEGQPTFAGIVPTGRQPAINPTGQPTMATIVPTNNTGVPAVLPTIPALGIGQGTTALPAIPTLGTGHQTMQDFTAGAPARAPNIPMVIIPGVGAEGGGFPIQLN